MSFIGGSCALYVILVLCTKVSCSGSNVYPIIQGSQHGQRVNVIMSSSVISDSDRSPWEEIIALLAKVHAHHGSKSSIDRQNLIKGQID